MSTATIAPSALPLHHPRVAHFMPYWFNDSWYGVRQAARLGYHYMDQDAHVLADGTVVIKHWGVPRQDGFAYVEGSGGRVPDPHGDRPLSDRTWEEVSRLRRRRGETRYHRARAHMRWCAERNIVMCLEAKADHAFEAAEVFERLRHDAEREQCHLVVMTLQDIGRPLARLRAAHDAGLETALLPRGRRPDDWSTWTSHVDRVWGRWHS